MDAQCVLRGNGKRSKNKGSRAQGEIRNRIFCSRRERKAPAWLDWGCMCQLFFLSWAKNRRGGIYRSRWNFEYIKWIFSDLLLCLHHSSGGIAMCDLFMTWLLHIFINSNLFLTIPKTVQALYYDVFFCSLVCKYIFFLSLPLSLSLSLSLSFLYFFLNVIRVLTRNQFALEGFNIAAPAPCCHDNIFYFFLLTTRRSAIKLWMV